VPDVSLTAAGHDGYLVEQEGGLYLVGGTSASTPSFAGIMAILDQYTGARNGNPNAKFYSLAASTPAAYHDITTGSNAVPCTGGTPNCSAGLPATNVGKMTGYSAGPGYDLATGLGSVDAYALARGWGGAQVAPSITSLSPNPMKGSNTAQALTITGTGFVAGLSIKVGTMIYGPSQLTSVSGTKVVLNVTVGTAAQNLAVEAINTTGPASNMATLQVTGTPPAIGALSPNPMTGSNNGQVLTITGTGFQSGLTLQIGSTLLTSSQLMSVAATQIQVDLIVGLTTRAFAVTVTNPDGQGSGSVNFQVNAPPAPSISSLSPSQMTGSNAAQTLTVNGTNFQSGAGLTVLVGATNYTGSQVTLVSGSQIRVPVVTGVGARTLNVRVTNPSGMASNAVTLAVK
jgi:subtilase family serine protease